MLLPALTLAAAGCGKKPETAPPAQTNAPARGVEKIKREAKDAVTATTGYSPSKRNGYKRAFRTK